MAFMQSLLAAAVTTRTRTMTTRMATKAVKRTMEALGAPEEEEEEEARREFGMELLWTFGEGTLRATPQLGVGWKLALVSASARADR
jgi:hypothetical protein